MATSNTFIIQTLKYTYHRLTWIKTYSLDEVKDRFIGKTGTAKRDRFEYKLQMEVIAGLIKKANLNK